jgi:hypothetical protein
MVKHLARDSRRCLGGRGCQNRVLACMRRHDSPYIELRCEDKVRKGPLVVDVCAKHLGQVMRHGQLATKGIKHVNQCAITNVCTR